jgi:hypothetical protein
MLIELYVHLCVPAVRHLSSQLLRHLLERPAPSLPHWRRQRPAIMVEAAEMAAPTSQPAGLCVSACESVCVFVCAE